MNPAQEMQQAAALGRILGTIEAIKDFKDVGLPYNWVTMEKNLLKNFEEYMKCKNGN